MNFLKRIFNKKTCRESIRARSQASQTEKRNDPAGLEEELDFWDREMSLKSVFAQFTKKRISPEQRKDEFPTSFFDAIMGPLESHFGARRPFKCIELGSGPLSNLAYGVDSGMIEVTGIDVLANEYQALYAKHGLIDFPIKPLQGSGESLADLFEKETFHCAYARNSLDHTRDIVLSFHNLVSLVKPNGYVILQHSVREGSRNNWSHGHYWDLLFNEHGLVAFDSQGKEFQLQRGLGLEYLLVYYRAPAHEGWIDIVIRRTW